MIDTYAPLFPQLLRDVRAILKNFQQWPTAAQADSQYQTFIREHVRVGRCRGRNIIEGDLTILYLMVI